VFTADPSARAFDGRIYVYPSHDVDDQDGSEVTGYHVFSSNDLVNWQDHGGALDAHDMPWVWNRYAHTHISAAGCPTRETAHACSASARTG
jgi:arabinoxylan arabinofuranohydrolase